MTRDQFIAVAASGRVVGVTFIKANGDTRVLSGRLGVKKHLRGGTKAGDDVENDVVTLFDMAAQGYRSIKVDSIRKIEANGKTIFERK